ncbi:2Fe-2S iron-sulfur cluster-binding protein [Actinoplanes sp. NPDC020271]
MTGPAGRSLLGGADDAGVNVSFSCREGTCGRCETRSSRPGRAS